MTLIAEIIPNNSNIITTPYTDIKLKHFLVLQPSAIAPWLWVE